MLQQLQLQSQKLKEKQRIKRKLKRQKYQPLNLHECILQRDSKQVIALQYDKQQNIEKQCNQQSYIQTRKTAQSNMGTQEFINSCLGGFSQLIVSQNKQEKYQMQYNLIEQKISQINEFKQKCTQIYDRFQQYLLKNKLLETQKIYTPQQKQRKPSIISNYTKKTNIKSKDNTGEKCMWQIVGHHIYNLKKYYNRRISHDQWYKILNQNYDNSHDSDRSMESFAINCIFMRHLCEKDESLLLVYLNTVQYILTEMYSKLIQLSKKNIPNLGYFCMQMELIMKIMELIVFRGEISQGFTLLLFHKKGSVSSPYTSAQKYQELFKYINIYRKTINLQTINYQCIALFNKKFLNPTIRKGMCRNKQNSRNFQKLNKLINYYKTQAHYIEEEKENQNNIQIKKDEILQFQTFFENYKWIIEYTNEQRLRKLLMKKNKIKQTQKQFTKIASQENQNIQKYKKIQKINKQQMKINLDIFFCLSQASFSQQPQKYQQQQIHSYQQLPLIVEPSQTSFIFNNLLPSQNIDQFIFQIHSNKEYQK